MNICIVTTWFERGAAYVSKQYKESLERQGHNVFIYARGEDTCKILGSHWDLEEVELDSKENFPISTYIDLKLFKKWLLKNKIEVVFFNEQRWMEPALLCKKMNLKTGLYIDYYTEEHLEVFKVFDFLICNTLKHYHAFKGHHDQVYYIPWGTNIELFDVVNKRKESNKLRFFVSAGMNPYRKGVDQVLIGMKRYLEKNKIYENEIALIIHTQVDLKSFFKLSEINLAIDFLIEKGILQIENKTVSAPGLYFKGDVYIYLSRLDGIGLTIAEALASGMPVIVPDDAPMNEFVTSNDYKVKLSKLYSRKDGYYWPQNEICLDDFQNKIHFFLENKKNIKEMQESAKKYSTKYLNWMDRDNDLHKIFRESRKKDLLDKEISLCKKHDEKFFNVNLKKLIFFKIAIFLKRIVQY